jgi:enterochelin esterase family protein
MQAQIWRRPDDIVSPEVLDDNSVVFRVQAEDASSVMLTGTWPANIERMIPMEKKDASLYEVKIGPLPSDMYEYEFIIDGVPALDPRNRDVTHDGAWIQNRLIIPGQQAELYDVNPVPHGKVTAVWYPSPTLGQHRRMNIYTPPRYEDEDHEYPVLYLLHGGGGDEEVWLNRGRANYILDNLIAAGEAQPMLVVFPNGYPNYAGAPLHRPYSTNQTPGISPMVSGKYETSLISDIVPYIDKNYRVKADPDHRAIAGFSMGGYHTQVITNSNPDAFKYIGVMSMGLFNELPEVQYSRDQHLAQLQTLKIADPKLYWIGMGKEDFLYQHISKLLGIYDEVGLRYLYRETAGHHDWNSWRPYLAEFLPLLFK